MKPNNNVIALACILMGTSLVIFIFAESRNDPGLRMAALVAATSSVSTLLAIASTMLTGKDLTKREPEDLPPGSISAQSSVVQTPPITANPTQAVEPPEKSTT